MSKSKKKRFQFFTTDREVGWYPIDHFFYAQSAHDKNNRIVEKGAVVHLEAHASMRNANGFSVSVIEEQGKFAVAEEFDDYPAALRRMADIIEAHSKKT